MTHRDEKDIGPSRDELIAAKGPFGLAVIAIVVVFLGVVCALAWALSYF